MVPIEIQSCSIAFGSFSFALDWQFIAAFPIGSGRPQHCAESDWTGLRSLRQERPIISILRTQKMRRENCCPNEKLELFHRDEMLIAALLASASAIFDTQEFYRKRQKLMEKERALRAKERQLIADHQRELPSHMNDPRWDQTFADEEGKIRKEIADVRDQIRQVDQQEMEALQWVPTPRTTTTAEAPAEQQQRDAAQQDDI
jgi:hypothetical protein